MARPATLSPLTTAMLLAHPSASARVLETQDPEDVAVFLEMATVDHLVPIIDDLPASYVARFLALVNAERRSEFAERMALGQLGSMLRCLDQTQRNEILEALPPRKRVLLGAVDFSELSVGAWVDPDSVIVPPRSSVRDAMRRARRFAGDAVLIAVVDQAGQFQGVLDTAKLIRVPINTRVDEVLEQHIFPLRASMNLANVAQHDAWTQHRALPVVDNRNQYVGILYYHALRKALEETHGVGAGEVDAFASLWSAYATGLGALTGMMWRILEGPPAADGDDADG